MAGAFSFPLKAPVLLLPSLFRMSIPAAPVCQTRGLQSLLGVPVRLGHGRVGEFEGTSEEM